MKRLLTLIRRIGADSRGAAAVETILIMPLAILFLVTGLEAGNYMYAEHQVSKGVRDAARYAARLPFSTYNCTSATSEAGLATGTAWDRIAQIAIYGRLLTANGNGGYTAVGRRVWTWDAQSSDIAIRYACVANTGGIYATSGFAPVITIIGKPEYPSLFKTMTGLTGSLRLYAKQQAVGAGI